MNIRDYVAIDYTNWRGLRRKRLVRILGWRFGSTEYHKEPQWLFRAYCVESGEEREFSLFGLHGAEPAPPPAFAASDDNVLTLS